MSATTQHLDKYVDVAALESVRKHAVEAHEEWILSSAIVGNELEFISRTEEIGQLAKFLRDDRKCQFKVLVDIAGVDWLQRPHGRFDVVYQLLSLTHNMRCRIKIRVDESGSVPSLTPVYSAANWCERECFDLFGINFDNHPDLRRILTDYGFNGHPLRKDFPLNGHVETYFDVAEQRVAYKPVDLPQELRNFDKVSAWKGMDNNARLAEEDNIFDISEFAEDTPKAGGKR